MLKVNVDTLQETLRQVEAYNTSMRNKIEVTKREANKVSILNVGCIIE